MSALFASTATYILVSEMKKKKSKQRGVEASDITESSSPSGEIMVKEEPREYDDQDMHADALEGDMLNREVGQHGVDSQSEANERLVSDTIGNVLNLGRQLRLSRDEVVETDARLESVTELHTENLQKMREIVEKELSATSMANAQIVKLVLQAVKRSKAVKYLLADNKSIRESKAKLSKKLKRAKAKLVKLSSEKVAADDKVRKLSGTVATLQQEGVGMKNDLSLLSYEKAQVEGALGLACDLKVLEENQSENLKKMSELDKRMVVSTARKFELEMQLARARASLNYPTKVKREPSSLPTDGKYKSSKNDSDAGANRGREGARCCWASVKYSYCQCRYSNVTMSDYKFYK